MDITKFGHATLLLEQDGTRILVDPGSFTDAAAFEVDGLAAVLITHEHPDHVQPDRMPALLAANPGAVVAGPPSVASLLRGTTDVRVLQDGDALDLGPLTVDVVGGAHQLVHPRMPRIENVGLVVADADGTRLFHPGDSYEVVPEGIDVLAVPISSPWGKLGETVDFISAVAPRTVFPIHDALLSRAGRQLFWSWIPMLVGDAVTSTDPDPGQRFRAHPA
ncbi:MBL fold metallo-hydrolase [Nakamurella leprariae]|uniref:MBL fold metallo-hydrolase n=1 Tax=Nakamurella leprariae TaxID=2803911 RepID=A0A938YGN1_9ACTN|nr:MBL fold metallo-hydrolase [Nakamurella leprariae]MBM9467774.1 MBL fold metallo-hydrolase [Nakamurella leprariae]